MCWRASTNMSSLRARWNCGSWGIARCPRSVSATAGAWPFIEEP